MTQIRETEKTPSSSYFHQVIVYGGLLATVLVCLLILATPRDDGSMQCLRTECEGKECFVCTQVKDLENLKNERESVILLLVVTLGVGLVHYFQKNTPATLPLEGVEV